jgi:hypothetical protein
VPMRNDRVDLSAARVPPEFYSDDRRAALGSGSEQRLAPV